MPPPPAFSLALPTVKTLEDCARVDLTVAPYLQQLTQINLKHFSITNRDELAQAYTSTNPLTSALVASLVVAQIVFVVSTINRNYSQIDRLWSILPTVYNAHYWYWGYIHGIRSQRLDVLVIFSMCWSARLTYNYWRKGGYNVGSEDYRWALIKNYINNDLIWVPFNYIIISLFQSVLLAAVTTPAYVLLLASRIEPALATPDVFFPQLLAFLLVIEFLADNQQWAFHQAKSYYQKNAKVPPGWKVKDVDRGFNTTGLFSYSRHPNFAAEQGIWLAIYQWGSSLTNTLYNWTFVGVLFYLMVFQASTPMTEYISAGKYPEYKEYQARVGKFVPKLTGGPSWKEYAAEQNKSAAVNGNAPAAEKQTKKLR